MTNKMIDNRINKLQQIEAKIKALNELAEAIRAELKNELEASGADERSTDRFTIRWKEIVTRRLDGKALKAALPDMFESFSRESRTRRFTVA